MPRPKPIAARRRNPPVSTVTRNPPGRVESVGVKVSSSSPNGGGNCNNRHVMERPIAPAIMWMAGMTCESPTQRPPTSEDEPERPRPGDRQVADSEHHEKREPDAEPPGPARGSPDP